MISLEQFYACVRQLVSPSCNKDLLEATKSLESFRKEPNAILLLMEALSGDALNTEEIVFTSQILCWTSFRTPHGYIDMNEILPALLELTSSLSVPAMRNTIQAFTVLVTKVYIGGDGSSFYDIMTIILDSYARLLSPHTTLCIMKFIPEICRNTLLYHGRKEIIEKHLLEVECSILQALPMVLKALVDALVMICNPDGTVRMPLSRCLLVDTLSTVQEWAQAMSSSSNHISSATGDVWLESGVLDYTATIMVSLWPSVLSEGSAGGCIATILSQDVTLLQSCGEGIGGILRCAYGSADTLSHILTQVLALYADGMNATTRSLEIVFSQSATSLNHQNLLESAAECSSDMDLLAATFALALSDDMVTLYHKCSHELTSSFAPWECFLGEVIRYTNRLYALVVAATEGLVSTGQEALHRRYYAIRIIVLRCMTIILSFWHGIFEPCGDSPVCMWHMALIPDMLASLIGHTAVVDNPRFMALRRGVCVDADELWTAQQEDEATLFRRDARELFRLVGKVSSTSTTLPQSFSVYTWSLDCVISELTGFHEMLNDEGSTYGEFATYVKILSTEATLHYFSAVVSNDIINLLAMGSAAGHSASAIAITTIELLQNMLLVLSPRGMTCRPHAGWNLQSIARLLCRIAVIIVADMLPIVEHVVDTAYLEGVQVNFISLWRNSYEFIIETLVFPECLNWQCATETELSTYCSTLPFRAKQDHIGCVTIYRLLHMLRKTTQECPERSHELLQVIVSSETPIIQLHRALQGVLDDNQEQISLLKLYIETLLSFTADCDDTGSRMTWKSFLLLHDALCLQLRMENDIYELQRRSEGGPSKVSSIGSHLPVILPAMGMAVCVTNAHSSTTSGGGGDEKEDLLMSIVDCTYQNTADYDRTRLLDMLLSLGLHARQHGFAIERLCEVIGQTVERSRPECSKFKEEDIVFFQRALCNHIQMINGAIFPFIQYLMERCLYSDNVVGGVLRIAISCCVCGPIVSMHSHDARHAMQSKLDIQADMIHQTFHDISRLVMSCFTMRKYDGHKVNSVMLEALVGATALIRCLLGWCPIFDTSALVKIIFDDVIAEFLSSIGWDHRSRACSQYFTITPYSKFFEFIFSCIGITCITEDSAVCGMTLRCGDRVDIILFVCHIWDGFLSGHVVCDEGNDDDDSSKFIKHVITLLCVVLGGITVPQNETLIVDTPSQWSPSNATKYLESDMMYKQDVLRSTSADRPHGMQYPELLDASIVYILINCALDTLRCDLLSFNEKEPVLRLLQKVILCCGANHFTSLMSALTTVDKKSKAMLLAISNHAELSNWRQFKNTVKAFAK